MPGEHAQRFSKRRLDPGLKKAFDTVDRDILISKLQLYDGLHGNSRRH